ncbi:hypothetical protein HMI54_013279, partial [Coelomomyces lativittatus]
MGLLHREKNKTAFRLRRSCTRDPHTSTSSVHWWVAIKSKPVLENGINRVLENESPIDATHAESILTNLNNLHSSNAQSHALLSQITQTYSGPFHILGTYQTLRFTYAWNESLKLELDETS